MQYAAMGSVWPKLGTIAAAGVPGSVSQLMQRRAVIILHRCKGSAGRQVYKIIFRALKSSVALVVVDGHAACFYTFLEPPADED